MHLAVVGSINADLYVEVERLPRPGETIPGGAAAVRPGGKGSNQAIAAGRLGMATRFVGQVGDDVHAPLLRQALAWGGVDAAAVKAVPGPSGQAFILLQRGGENSIIIVGGANRAWSGLDEAGRGAISGAGMLLLQREVPEAVNLAAAQAARRAGVPVLLDAGGDDGPLPEALLPLLAVLSPNETELARLTGLPTGDEAQVIAAAQALRAKGVGEVLVKLGRRGSLLVGADGAVLRYGIFTLPVVDTTGAGDCFTAAFAVARCRGLKPQEQLLYASAAAGICVGRKGAAPSMPTGDEVAALLQTAI